MERKIGEIFNRDGEWYQCVECDSCGNCSLRATECGSGTKSDLADEVFGQCSKVRRSDNKHAIFKKLEKVGEPFKVGRELCQHYKVFDIDNVCGDVSWNVHNYKAKTILIELKQNEEDMKTIKINKEDLDFLIDKIRYKILPKHVDYNKITNEISKLFSVDDAKHSNTENIGKTLKPFNLEAAKSGKPVCTRSGKPVRIICFDKITCKNYEELKIIALVREKDNEDIHVYNNNGKKYLEDSPIDLMMLPETKEGWVNVYTNRIGGPYTSREYAIRQRMGYCIDTVKIQWEE